jgi:uncharacterized protein YegP (UPF0339 family)
LFFSVVKKTAGIFFWAFALAALEAILSTYMYLVRYSVKPAVQPQPRECRDCLAQFGGRNLDCPISQAVGMRSTWDASVSPRQMTLDGKCSQDVRPSRCLADNRRYALRQP